VVTRALRELRRPRVRRVRPSHPGLELRFEDAAARAARNLSALSDSDVGRPWRSSSARRIA